MKCTLPLIFILVLRTITAYGQMPQCHMLYWDDRTYIYNYDPSLPISATNPVQNTIVPLPGHSGITVCRPLDGSSSALTFYTTHFFSFDSGYYFYYNGATATWVNTGHRAAAPNIGGGGGYIYNLYGPQGKLYRYNGINEVLITDSARTGDYDIAADCDANWYLLSRVNSDVYLKKFDSSGRELRAWRCVIQFDSSGMQVYSPSAGLAIIGDTLYFDNSLNRGINFGIIGDSTVMIDTTLITSPIIRFQGDYASCPGAVQVAPRITIATPNQRLCQGGLATFSSASDKGSGPATYQWQVNGTNAGSNSSAFSYIPADGDTVTCTLFSSDRCGNIYTSRSNAVIMIVDTPTLIPSVTIANAGNTFCDGQAATFIASPINGGTPVYQWMKNGAGVGINADRYTDNSLVTGDMISVSMTGNMPCAVTGVVRSNTITVTIVSSVVPGININTIPPTILCAGTPVTFLTNEVGGGAQPQYQWYKSGIVIPGATGATYTDAGLADEDTLTVALYSSAACPVTQPTVSNKVGVRVYPVVLPEVSLSASPGTTISPGQVVVFTAAAVHGGISPVYHWFVNSSSVATTSVNTWMTGNLRDGDVVKVRLDSREPCPVPGLIYSNALVMHQTTDVPGHEGSNLFSIYPNPAKDILNIDLLNASLNGVLQLFDNQGRLIMTPEKLTEKHHVTDVHHLPAGIYFYSVTIGSAQYRGKLLKF